MLESAANSHKERPPAGSSLSQCAGQCWKQQLGAHHLQGACSVSAQVGATRWEQRLKTVTYRKLPLYLLPVRHGLQNDDGVDDSGPGTGHY